MDTLSLLFFWLGQELLDLSLFPFALAIPPNAILNQHYSLKIPPFTKIPFEKDFLIILYFLLFYNKAKNIL